MPEVVNTTPIVEELTSIRGLRSWAKDLKDMPQIVKRLMEAANKQDLTPSTILFEYCAEGEGIWNVVLLGED